MEAMVAHVHRGEHYRTQVNCPRCDGVLRAQEFPSVAPWQSWWGRCSLSSPI